MAGTTTGVPRQKKGDDQDDRNAYHQNKSERRQCGSALGNSCVSIAAMTGADLAKQHTGQHERTESTPDPSDAPALPNRAHR